MKTKFITSAAAGLFAAAALAGAYCLWGGPELAGDAAELFRGGRAPMKQADIDMLAEELPERHIDLFHELPEGQYRAMIEELRGRAEALSDAEFEIELRRVAAAVGDAHTSVGLPLERLFPFALYDYGEALRVTGTLPEYQRALGQQLVAVDGVGIEELRERLRPVISCATEMQFRYLYPIYLISPRILEGLGVDTDGSGADGSKGGVEFEIETEAGERFGMRVPAVLKERVAEFTRVFTDEGALASKLLYFRNYTRTYWAVYDEEREIAYLQYNSCRNDPKEPFARMVRRWERSLEGKPLRAIVIDLRRNGGGDSRVMRPLIDELEAGRRNGREHGLFVLIGRRTFSSAVLNAIDLKQKAGAVLVGEPAGGEPNHYGEARSFELPYSGLSVQYSTKYFDTYRDGGETLVPDIAAPPRFEELAAGRDPAIEAVMRAVKTVAGVR